jgi:hypothetical protein
MDRLPDGWFAFYGDIALYNGSTKRFNAGPFYVSLYYRYALNRWGQKTIPIRQSGSTGTNLYKEIQLGYFVVGICTHWKLVQRLGRFLPWFRDGFWKIRAQASGSVKS